MNKISISSDTSPNPDSGATDSPWQPSWWQWLILALSGTLEIERQIAWLKKSSEEARQRHEQRMSELRKETEELRKNNDEARQRHEQRMSELRKETEELRKNNDEARQSHELRMSELRKETEQVRKETEQLRKENERLAELELKLDAVLPKSVSN
jgi:DNA repair exonuclease SbcCD ATPase subunit